MNNLMRRHFMGGKKEADPTESFIITVSVGAGDTFSLPLVSGGNYNFQADWGDDATDQITVFNQAETTHTYATAGQYDISMNGVIEGWSFGFNNISRLFITDIKQFGGNNGVIFNINSDCFSGCSNLDISATDNPSIQLDNCTNFFLNCTSLIGNSNFNNWDLSSVTSIRQFYRGCSNFNQDIGSWDVSNVTDFRAVFKNSIFNQDISGWNMSSATNLSEMFALSPFNEFLNNWERVGSTLANVTDFSLMFSGATSFNQNIGDWDVSLGTNFNLMFNAASVFNNGNSSDINNWSFSVIGNINVRQMFRLTPLFNQDLNLWNTERFRDCSEMFINSTGFNGQISGWDLSNANDIRGLFKGATSFNNGGNSGINNITLNNSEQLFADSLFSGCSSFNQPINDWDVSTIENFQDFFFNCSVFNQELNSWDVSSATNLFRMFGVCPLFNGNISSWDVSSVEDFTAMFGDCTNFNSNISSWVTSSATNLSLMFADCASFNQDISGWNTGLVENMSRIFNIGGGGVFDQDLGGWNITSLTNATEMFKDVTLSTANYDSLLIGWDAQAVQNNVNFHGGNSQNTAGSAAATARQNLITDHSWTITDGGSI